MAPSATASGVSSRRIPPSNALLYGATAALGVVLAWLLAQVNLYVPEPYMVSASRSISSV